MVNKKRKGKQREDCSRCLKRRPMNRRQTVRILRPVGGYVLIRMFLMKSSLNSKKTKCVNYCSLHLKTDVIRRKFRPRQRPISTKSFEGIKESPVQRAYRNKMEFSFGDEYRDGPLALGMHKRGEFL